MQNSKTFDFAAALSSRKEMMQFRLRNMAYMNPIQCKSIITLIFLDTRSIMHDPRRAEMTAGQVCTFR
jgi:hypothetical protein